ncbi:hypothetical protein PIB30_090070 [Stylosanthes scabra]|uniref:Uncharacterized protein n=1 Tax=Stylosanthes scabra TaxID=79078 RepID=A0ABU6VW66_9FABA|nr:hypothetical protein [Stylosanthes scabra]
MWHNISLNKSAEDPDTINDDPLRIYPPQSQWICTESGHIYDDSLRICSLNNTDHYGYIKRGSAPLSGTSSKPYHIACVRGVPKSLFGEALLALTHLSHKPPTFHLGTTGYAGSPKPLEEGVVYTDHSGDDQRRNQQQQQALDLNATTNEATGSGNVNTDSGGIQNGQPPPRNPIQGNRQSAFDRIGLGGPTQWPFGGTVDESQIAQELRHRMQAMELEVRELRKENAELRSSTRNPQPCGQTPPRRRSRSKSRSPPRRTQRPQTPPRRRHHHSSSSDSDSSSGRDHNGRRRTYRRYKRTRDRTVTPPIDGHMMRQIFSLKRFATIRQVHRIK